MLRFLLALCAVVVIALSGSVTTASAAPESDMRSRFDLRVDALPRASLVTLPPKELVDPSRQRGARIVTDVQQSLFFVWAAAQIFAFGWLWRSGNAARLRDWLRRRLRNVRVVRIAFGAILGAYAPLAALPFAFIRYRVGFNVGLTDEIIGAWLVRYALTMCTDALLTALVVVVVLELVDRTRLWYLAFTVFLFAITIGIAGIDPLVSARTGHDVATPIAASVPVERATTSRKTMSARVAGLGDLTRIIVGQPLLSAATAPELGYVLAHEDAHVAHRDVLKVTLMWTTLLVLACVLAVLISDRIGFRRDDDVLSRLALVGAFLGGAALLIFPLYNGYARGIEYRADEDARQRLSDPSAAIRFLVRRADDDMVTLCERRSSSWYFADHPALGSRIAAMRGSEDPCPRYGH